MITKKMSEKNFGKIRYLVIDVDGTLTDSGLYYDNHGNELKKFSTRDAIGFFAARENGIKTIVLTGRECSATVRRMEELKVDMLVQNCKDKVAYLVEFLKNNNINCDEIGYIGDDINDYPGMKLCGFVGCPADACEEVKQIADYVSSYNGGYGAVRDVISFVLKKRGEWTVAINNIFGAGI